MTGCQEHHVTELFQNPRLNCVFLSVVALLVAILQATCERAGFLTATDVVASVTAASSVIGDVSEGCN